MSSLIPSPSFWKALKEILKISNIVIEDKAEFHLPNNFYI